MTWLLTTLTPTDRGKIHVDQSYVVHRMDVPGLTVRSTTTTTKQVTNTEQENKCHEQRTLNMSARTARDVMNTTGPHEVMTAGPKAKRMRVGRGTAYRI